MKKYILTILILAFLAIPAYGALTNSVDVDAGQITSYWWTGTPLMDIAWLNAKEVESILEGETAIGSLWFDPTDTAPDTDEGMVYYHESDESLKLRTSSAWVDIDVSGASSLGTAYGIGSAITVDTDAITLTTTDAANNVILALVHAETGNFSPMTISNASAYPSIAITTTGAGADITGSSATWSVSAAGVGTFVSLVLENGETIKNDSNNEIEFAVPSGEDISFNLATSNTCTLTTDSGLDSFAFGVVDDLEGVGTIVFDDAASTITETGTTNGYDLTIAQAGTIDVSLILSSAGSITDALSLITTDSVGVIKISSSDVLDIDTIDDIDIDISDGTYTLTINGGTAAHSYQCTTDSVPQSVTLVAADATAWVVTQSVGTWVNKSN